MKALSELELRQALVSNDARFSGKDMKFNYIIHTSYNRNGVSFYAMAHCKRPWPIFHVLVHMCSYVNDTLSIFTEFNMREN